MLSVNEYGVEVFEEMLDLAEELNVEVIELDNGTMVVDAGVSAKGGFEAGLFIARICMADLADIRFTTYNIDELSLPAVEVTTDHPIIACMASQYAGWRVKVGKFFGMGSGPARCLLYTSPSPRD